MKILFVSCLLPYPGVTHGGGVDLFHLIETLGARHEVSLVSIVSEGEIGHVAEIAPYCEMVRTVVPAWSLKQKVRQGWRGLWTRPWMLGRRARAEMRGHIRQIVAEFKPDVVQFEWTETGDYLDAVTGAEAARVLDEVDVSYRPLEYQAERRGTWGRRLLARGRGGRAQESELALCQQFDAVLTRSEYDRQVLLAEVPELNVEVLQPWTHVDRFADITLQGNDSVDGCYSWARWTGKRIARRFCISMKRVYPLVRRHCVGVDLWVVGANPQRRIQRLC